jgi:plasmid replication initiation protein
MELGRVNKEYLIRVTNGLLCKVVNIPDDQDGYIGFQLFKECRVVKDKTGEIYIQIDAHDDALPLMFEFQAKYFNCQLWKALRFRNPTYLRMYAILKPYEHIGSRVLEVGELRQLLGLDDSDYPRYGNFKIRVLDTCQQELQDHTDLKFRHEIHGKKGNNGKILRLNFIIEKNENFVDQFMLADFIDERRLAAVSGKKAHESNKHTKGIS